MKTRAIVVAVTFRCKVEFVFNGKLWWVYGDALRQSFGSVDLPRSG